MNLGEACAQGIRELSEQELLAWVRLIRSENIGPRSFSSLLQRFGSAAKALEALPELIKQGRPARAIKLASKEEVDQEYELIQACGGRFIALCEPEYPPLLRQIDAAPPVISLRGDVNGLARSKVAIVGARNASAAGLAFTERLARGIAEAGHMIVSGLARGIDARAHQASLRTGTIAVVAGGLGQIYPSDHVALLEKILEHGAVISEMPFGWEARGRDFPRRNRIVSGISQALVVVEAARRSGSLITARFAAEQGRQVFAVPGSPLDLRAEGTNDLLQEGASFCTKAEDVIEALARQGMAMRHEELSESSWNADVYRPLWEDLGLSDDQLKAVASTANHEKKITSPEALADAANGPGEDETRKNGQAHESNLTAKILELLGPTPVSIDELIRLGGFSARQVRMALLELELAGRLEFHGNSLVSLR